MRLLLWSACAEFLHLARLGIDVVSTPLKRLAPFLGRGKLPKLVRDKKQETQLHSGKARNAAEDDAWSYRDGAAFGADLHNLDVSVLRQLFRRSADGHKANRTERDFIRSILCEDTGVGCCITAILIADRPTSDENQVSDDALKLIVREFKDALNRLAEGSPSKALAIEYSDTCQRLHRALMVKRRKEGNEEFAAWICKDLANHSSKLHAYIKHNRAPPSMHGKDVWKGGGVTTDAALLLAPVLKDWETIWGCDDPDKVSRAAKEIRRARIEALPTAGDAPPCARIRDEEFRRPFQIFDQQWC